MCGIVGYVGDRQAQDILVNGLEKLEYRGYDSAGLAVFDEGKIDYQKKKGRIQQLKEVLDEKPLAGSVGIGHTRWATHGEPSDVNAHPHVSSDEKIAVVHNGIIENYMELKDKLIKEGYEFQSDTDTEVVAHLLDSYYDGDIFEAAKKTAKDLKGSYSLGIMSSDDPDKLIAIRKNSPLIIGMGENENFIASDVPAILEHTRNIYYLDNDEIAVLTKDSVDFYDEDGNSIEKKETVITWDPEDAEKGGYPYFMLKEINEQPKAIEDTLIGRITEDGIKLDDVIITKEDLDKIDHVHIVACGTAYNAGLLGKAFIEKYARIPIEIETASEYRYKDPIITENTLLIVLSQSGETADTLAAIDIAKKAGARVLAITNVVGSSVAREADDILYTNAGPEIAVASTKAYVTQVACMLLIALHLAKLKGLLSEEDQKRIAESLLNSPKQIEEALEASEEIEEFAYENKDLHDVYLIGRGLDYDSCIEGSLKIKEISYVHSESFSAGELKHGPIALVEDGTVLLVVATQDKTFDKLLSNILEVRSRGAKVLAIAQEKHRDALEKAGVEKVFCITDLEDDIAPIPAVVYLQLFAYYLAVARGCDVDKPKNLAKSVTVE